MGRSRTNAEDAGQADVQDEIDRVITSEAQTASFEIGSREFRALEDVNDALRRLDDGTYGKCTLCGREIDEARLRAIPETPYCREDAERMEQEQGQGFNTPIIEGG